MLDMARKLLPLSSIFAAIMLAVLSMGCGIGPGETGTFDKTFSVTGPVQLEVNNGSGRVEIRSGQSREVRVHAEFTVWLSFFDDKNDHLGELRNHPPVDQQGNLIRVESHGDMFNHIRVDYTIYVPTETEVRANDGSGSIEVNDIQGPVNLQTGSGHIGAHRIRNDAETKTGSGSIELIDIGTRATAETGSGGIELSHIGGDIHATTGSGSIRMDRAPSRIVTHTGSGTINISGAGNDLRASSGSGSIHIDGNPEPSSYWDIHASSGSITLTVPTDAGFRIHARSGSGGIETDLPVTMEEQTGRHEMRGRIGNGSASVDLQTGSGGIHIRR
jgi:lia operon protein LiaG